jgi:outer membrane protein OmpA-like peptidoglycan-associated protein
MRTFISLKQSLLAASVALALSACATTSDEIPELQTARAVVAQVQSSPMADRAAGNVNAATKALNEANDAAEKGRDIHEIKHLSYVATRNAQIANEKILAAQAEEAVKRGEAERERVMAMARTQEAQAARQQAQAATTAAQRAQLERDELQRQLEQLKDLNAKQTNRGLVLTLGDVLFDVNKSTLKPGADNTMDRLANFLKQGQGRSVIVEGHTDSTGSDEYNMQLSRLRADAVRTALIERGVQSSQIEATGKGESTPVASNDNAGGRQQNRRVEIIIPEERSQVALEGDE